MTTRPPDRLPFRSLRTLAGGKKGRYIVAAMFTASYAAKAQRLAASCEKFGLYYELHEVGSIHRSISPKGTDDLSYTKPHFIHHLLEVHRMPVLYVDADCEFVAQPHLIDELVSARCDFAIYNWLADPYTDRFVPLERVRRLDSSTPKNRFYLFAGSVDWVAKNQLQCSGLVQFYRHSAAARALLSKWHETIAAFPFCADDQVLDFTFNNLRRQSWLWWLLRVRWLPKPYARICWWIYAEPVINHPELPGTSSGFEKISDPKGRKGFYYSFATKPSVDHLLPRDYIIDTEQSMLCKIVDNRIVPVQETSQRFWL